MKKTERGNYRYKGILIIVHQENVNSNPRCNGWRRFYSVRGHRIETLGGARDFINRLIIKDDTEWTA